MANKYSHAEGYSSTATGYHSYAEGFNNLASAAAKIGASMTDVVNALQGAMLGGNDHIDTWKELSDYIIPADKVQSQSKKKIEESLPKDIGFTLQEVDMSGFEPVKLAPIGFEISGATEEPKATIDRPAAHSSNKLFKTRITLRYDTLENWESNPDFVPLRGEVCIIESPYESWGYHERHIVIGNGESTLLSMYNNRHYLTI